MSLPLPELPEQPRPSQPGWAAESGSLDGGRALPPPGPEQGPLDLERLLLLMERFDASDLHLKVGNPPIMRVHGKIRRLDIPPLEVHEVEQLLLPILEPRQRRQLEEGGDLDFAYSIASVGRYRLNAFRQRGTVSVAVRRVRTRIPTFEELCLRAESMRRIAQLRQGLVIVAGVTGSGKSTTLAATIEYINARRRCHVVTIEDPIEYLYRDKRAFVNQREIGIDVPSFASALKSVVRQDPDVILIGELRDPETTETALQAAETGHLVFGTVHSSNVAQTIGRIVDMFPPDKERPIRSALRFNLKSIVCQKIVPRIAGDDGQASGLVPAQAILFVNSTAQKLIQQGEDEKLETLIRGAAEEGMQDFNQSLAQLFHQGLIDEQTALEHSPNPEQLSMNIKGIYLGEDRQIVR